MENIKLIKVIDNSYVQDKIHIGGLYYSYSEDKEFFGINNNLNAYGYFKKRFEVIEEL